MENGNLAPDFKSRYFTADFPFGLDILAAFAKMLGVKDEKMLAVSDWYHNVTATQREFCFADCGINSEKELLEFYSM